MGEDWTDRIVRETEVWIHPSRYSGKPCVGGRRVPVESVAVTVWLDGGVPSACADWGLTREAVLVACWYAGLYGIIDPYAGVTGKKGATRIDLTWIKRWRPWADQWGSAMWAGDWGRVPDPPSEGDANPYRCACGGTFKSEPEVWAHLDRFHGGSGFVRGPENGGAA